MNEDVYKIFLRAKITAQRNLYNEIAEQYFSLGKFEEYHTYSDICTGLQISIDIINSNISEPIKGHDLLDEIKIRKEA